MRISIVLSLLAASTACSAAPTNKRYVLHEKRHAEPHMWTKRSKAPSDQVLPVRIGLTQNNLHRAEEFILDVADPRSPNFGE